MPALSKSIAIGFDPEECGLAAEHRLIQNVGWVSIGAIKDDYQISRVLNALTPQELRQCTLKARSREFVGIDILTMSNHDEQIVYPRKKSARARK